MTANRTPDTLALSHVIITSSMSVPVNAIEPNSGAQWRMMRLHPQPQSSTAPRSSIRVPAAASAPSIDALTSSPTRRYSYSLSGWLTTR